MHGPFIYESGRACPAGQPPGPFFGPHALPAGWHSAGMLHYFPTRLLNGRSATASAAFSDHSTGAVTRPLTRSTKEKTREASKSTSPTMTEGVRGVDRSTGESFPAGDLEMADSGALSQPRPLRDHRPPLAQLDRRHSESRVLQPFLLYTDAPKANSTRPHCCLADLCGGGPPPSPASVVRPRGPGRGRTTCGVSAAARLTGIPGLIPPTTQSGSIRSGALPPLSLIARRLIAPRTPRRLHFPSKTLVPPRRSGTDHPATSAEVSQSHPGFVGNAPGKGATIFWSASLAHSRVALHREGLALPGSEQSTPNWKPSTGFGHQAPLSQPKPGKRCLKCPQEPIEFYFPPAPRPPIESGKPGPHAPGGW